MHSEFILLTFQFEASGLFRKVTLAEILQLQLGVIIEETVFIKT